LRKLTSELAATLSLPRSTAVGYQSADRCCFDQRNAVTSHDLTDETAEPDANFQDEGRIS